MGFNVFQGIGPKRFALLRNYFGSAKKAWGANKKQLLKAGLSPNLVESFLKFRKSFDFSSYFLRLRENEIKAKTLEDNGYPENLKKIDDAPFVLYVKGELKPEDELALAVVGTRRITGYGRQATEALVSELVAAGMTIVSGLAYGVDSVAHEMALSVDGRTVGVLASGLDHISPVGRLRLVEKIVNSGQGAVVSEFPLGMTPVKGLFPARNRIISGLSLGVLVTEGAPRSGAKITASHAAAQGREVFAVPGPITSQMSAAPADLIKMGAKLVSNVNDILERLNLESRIKKYESRKILPESPEEERLLALIQDEAKHLDQLVRESGLETGQVASIMSLMEIKGKVKNLGGMVYIINK